MQQSNHQPMKAPSAQKLCLHCPAEKRKPIVSKNFTKHIKEIHTERFIELKKESQAKNQQRIQVKFGDDYIEAEKEQQNSCQEEVKMPPLENILATKQPRQSEAPLNVDKAQNAGLELRIEILEKDNEMLKLKILEQEKRIEFLYQQLKPEGRSQSEKDAQVNACRENKIPVEEPKQEEEVIVIESESEELDEVDTSKNLKDVGRAKARYLWEDLGFTGKVFSFEINEIPPERSTFLKGVTTLGYVRKMKNSAGIKLRSFFNMLYKISKQGQEHGIYMGRVQQLIRKTSLENGFDLKKAISSGAVGTTVTAFDQELQLPRVLKLYHNPKYINQGILEYKVLQKFENAPHKVRAYNCFYIKDQFILLSLEDLSNYITPYKIMTEFKDKYSHIQRLVIARNICLAIAELHSKGYVHGDISSENFLVKPDTLAVKVIDLDQTVEVGTQVPLSGGIDFMSSKKYQWMHEKRTKLITATIEEDLHCLGMLLFPLTSLNKHVLDSWTGAALGDIRYLVLYDAQYLGKDVVEALIEGQITAEQASVILDKIYKEEQRLEELD